MTYLSLVKSIALRVKKKFKTIQTVKASRFRDVFLSYEKKKFYQKYSIFIGEIQMDFPLVLILVILFPCTK